MFPQRFTQGFICSCLRRNIQNSCLQCAGGSEGRLASKASDFVTLFCSASSRPTVRPTLCRPDPPVMCPGFGLDRLDLTGEIVEDLGESEDLSSPKPEHITSRSSRSARRSGQAGSGNIGCQQNYSPRKKVHCSLLDIEEMSLERFSRSTNKRNLI